MRVAIMFTSSKCFAMTTINEINCLAKLICTYLLQFPSEILQVLWINRTFVHFPIKLEPRIDVPITCQFLDTVEAIVQWVWLQSPLGVTPIIWSLKVDMPIRMVTGDNTWAPLDIRNVECCYRKRDKLATMYSYLMCIYYNSACHTVHSNIIWSWPNNPMSST